MSRIFAAVMTEEQRQQTAEIFRRLHCETGDQDYWELWHDYMLWGQKGGDPGYFRPGQPEAFAQPEGYMLERNFGSNARVVYLFWWDEVAGTIGAEWENDDGEKFPAEQNVFEVRVVRRSDQRRQTMGSALYGPQGADLIRWLEENADYVRRRDE